MLLSILFAFIIVLSNHKTKPEQAETLPIEERIKLLKFKIHQTQPTFDGDTITTLINENLEYVDIHAITPISRGDERIKDRNYMLPQLKTKKSTTEEVRPWDHEPAEKIYDDIRGEIIVLNRKGKERTTAETTTAGKATKKHDSQEFSVEVFTTIKKKKSKTKAKDKGSRKKSKRNKKSKTSTTKKEDSDFIESQESGDRLEKHDSESEGSKENNKEDVNSPVKIKRKHISEKVILSNGFRKQISNDMINTKVQGVHCQRVITPFFQGVKKEIEPPRHLDVEDRGVKRFLELLSMNITGYTKEESYALLYQISEMQVRLFQWDISAIRLLFDIVAGPGEKHTFKTLKHGIRKKFKKWHLDLHWNTTMLLKDTVLFRPLCFDKIGGSTLSSKVSRFIKSTTPGTTTNDDDCE